jgi:hypothetical protein
MANLVNFNKAIVSNGGASYNLMTGEFNPNHGYMVSVKDHEQTFNANKSSYQYEIADYVKQRAIMLMAGIVNKSIDRIFLGGWIEKGLLYLDVSYLVDTEEEAIQMAKDNDQLAYFNNVTKETIYI